MKKVHSIRKYYIYLKKQILFMWFIFYFYTEEGDKSIVISLLKTLNFNKLIQKSI